MTITFDIEQKNLLRDIQRHLAVMCADGFRKSVLSLFSHKSARSGIYIYGDVGRGKTTLVRHVFDQVHVTKQRYHCDTFFAELHRALQSQDIDSLAHNIQHKYRMIWIDELQIYDVATAMLLRRLIPALVELHVIVLMTGNIAPDDFYKGGLNREQFSDFISYFCRHFHCLALDGALDYRLQQKASQDNTSAEKLCHFWLASPAATVAMENIFNAFAVESIAQNGIPTKMPPSPFTLQLKHRTWVLAKTHAKAAFIDFSSLAQTSCAFDDYRALVQEFPTIFVTDVPIFNHTNRDACRRFMAFIDIMYDGGAELYMSAHRAPAELYQDSGQKLPFARTASRLAEIL
ncbi:MAG: cell division protein ZapE [Pseudomonadota bacterium]